jgi:hypothetical protein
METEARSSDNATGPVGGVLSVGTDTGDVHGRCKEICIADVGCAGGMGVAGIESAEGLGIAGRERVEVVLLWSGSEPLNPSELDHWFSSRFRKLLN